MKMPFPIAVSAAIFWLASAASLGAQGKGEPVVIGQYDKLYSKILNEERPLLVGLPDGYADSGETYPVLYVLDGGVDSFGEALSFVRSRGQALVPDMIVVAVTNTNRNRDLIPGPGREQAHRFLKFMTDELFPYVGSHYRANSQRILYGGSNAGLFVVYALLENRQAFSAYLASSPTVVHRKDFILEKAKEAAAGDYKNKFLSIIYGDRNLDPGVRESIRAVIAHFDQLVSLGLRLRTLDVPDGGHVPVGSLPFSLILLFEGYEYPREKRVKEGLDEARAYYDRLSEKIGFQVEVPLSVTATIAMLELTERKNYGKAIEAFESAVRETPRNAEMNYLLALAYFRDGNLDKARSYYFKVKELDPKGFPSPEFEEMKRAFEKASAAKTFLEKKNQSGAEAALAWLTGIDPAKDTGCVFEEKEFIASGNEMRSFGEVEEAVRFFLKTTAFFPSSSAIWETLGSTYIRLFQKEDAVRCFQKAIDLDPKNRGAQAQLRMIDVLLADTRDETRTKMKFRPGETTGLTGEYLGQELPGTKPELFAPGIVSVSGGNENTLTLTPDGKEIYFGKESGIWVSKLAGNGWSAPQKTGIQGYEMWISPDTGHMYYTGYEPGIWVTERAGDSWGNPRKLVSNGMFATMTRDGKMYTTVFGQNEASIGVYEIKDGKYGDSVILGPEINAPKCFDAHPNVTPDGRTIVFDSDRPGGKGLYVSFQKSDGTWSQARFLGEGFEGGSCSTFSPDGRYLFFMKSRDIYWVSAKILNGLRPKEH